MDITHGTRQASGATSRLKSIDELRADRALASQQRALSTRAARLRVKADALTKASQLLHLERPLVCAQLLLRLHRVELDEASVLARTGSSATGATGAGDADADGPPAMLRGEPELLTRRAELLLRALIGIAVEERSRSLTQMRQVEIRRDSPRFSEIRR